MVEDFLFLVKLSKILLNCRNVVRGGNVSFKAQPNLTLAKTNLMGPTSNVISVVNDVKRGSII